MRVLEVGTGSGYQAAVLASIGCRVITVERHAELAATAGARLAQLGLEDLVRIEVGDGSLGRPQDAPFDGIVVTAAAPAVPAALPGQLADGGRLVVPVGPRDRQELMLVSGTATTSRNATAGLRLRATRRRRRLRGRRTAPAAVVQAAAPLAAR